MTNAKPALESGNLSNLENAPLLCEQLSSYLVDRLGISYALAFELEWYAPADFTPAACTDLGYQVHAEDGKQQYECALPLYSSAQQAVGKLQHFKQALLELAPDSDFAALPHENQPPSGLHCHLSFDDERLLEPAIAGLLAMMPESVFLCCQNEADYTRFRYHGVHTTAPTYIAWGGNNRTTAIRIPDSTPRHLEYRLAPACAAPYRVACAVLAGAIYGIEKNLAPPKKIYGNAFDPQYGLSPLPASLAEARRAYNESLAWPAILDVLAQTSSETHSA